MQYPAFLFDYVVMGLFRIENHTGPGHQQTKSLTEPEKETSVF